MPGMDDVEHWHVTLTLSGDAWPADDVHDALARLLEERPFVQSCTYTEDTAEIRYWDQAESLHDAAAMALRLWGEHRRSARLPAWVVVGLEVVDRRTLRRREASASGRSTVAAVGVVRPLPV